MTVLLAVSADHQRWHDRPESDIAPVQVEMNAVRRLDMFMDAAEPLAWAKYVSVMLDEERGTVVLSVCGISILLDHIPDDATSVMPHCRWCKLPTIYANGSGYRHQVITGRMRHYETMCADGLHRAEPAPLAGHVRVILPTQETVQGAEEFSARELILGMH